jgi:tryptophan halogenase
MALGSAPDGVLSMTDPNSPVQRVVVLGGGSAGFLAAITLKTKLPDLAVYVLRSKQIGIIGVGEGTTVSVPNFLHGYLGIDPGPFHREVRPTYKLGIKFLWGPRPYFNYTFSPQFDMQYKALPRLNGYYSEDDVEYVSVNSSLMTHDKAFVRLPDGSPGVRNDVAYHLENAELVAFLERQALSLGVEVLDETVENVEQEEHGVTALRCTSGRALSADLWLDCSGFESFILGRALAEPFVSFKSSLFCDRAVVGGWDRTTEPVKPYTTAETMDSGWCWQIEHDHRINRGYVYSSSFITDADAEKEFRMKNPKVGGTRVVKFVSGRYRRGWVKNVVAIGNACGFVEPLESTSLFVICDEAQTLAGSLLDCGRRPGPAMAAVYNKRVAQTWDDIRRFLAIHYKYNTRLRTPFWDACVKDTDTAGAQEFTEYYAENGPSSIWRDHLIGGRDVFGFEGYLTMMVGQKVPYRKLHSPAAGEWQAWREIQQANRQLAQNGIGVSESVEIIRSPRWSYRRDFYRAM